MGAGRSRASNIGGRSNLDINGEDSYDKLYSDEDFNELVGIAVDNFNSVTGSNRMTEEELQILIDSSNNVSLPEGISVFADRDTMKSYMISAIKKEGASLSVSWNDLQSINDFYKGDFMKAFKDYHNGNMTNNAHINTFDKILSPISRNLEKQYNVIDALQKGFSDTLLERVFRSWGKETVMLNGSKIPQTEFARGNMINSVKCLNKLQSVFEERYGYTPKINLTFSEKPSKGDESVGGWFSSNMNQINITPNSLVSSPKVERNNSFVSNFGAESTVLHEYGHYLHQSIFSSSENIISTKNRQAVSTYGNSNHKEAFAEAFVFYATGRKPNRGKEYYSDFEALMKENGLEGFKNIYK